MSPPPAARKDRPQAGPLAAPAKGSRLGGRSKRRGKADDTGNAPDRPTVGPGRGRPADGCQPRGRQRRPESPPSPRAATRSWPSSRRATRATSRRRRRTASRPGTRPPPAGCPMLAASRAAPQCRAARWLRLVRGPRLPSPMGPSSPLGPGSPVRTPAATSPIPNGGPGPAPVPAGAVPWPPAASDQRPPAGLGSVAAMTEAMHPVEGNPPWALATGAAPPADVQGRPAPPAPDTRAGRAAAAAVAEVGRQVGGRDPPGEVRPPGRAP